MKKTGLKEMKRRNREMLIRTILEKGELSRIELAHETQLSPSTVSALVGELLEEGILAESGQRAITAGRSRTALDINTEYGCIAVVNIGRKGASLDLFDMCLNRCNGKVLSESYLSGNELLVAITAAVFELFDSASLHAGKVAGFGLLFQEDMKASEFNVMYSTGFAMTLVGMTMVTTLVILAVTSNVVLSLGMVGALSIVRFRAAIKEPMEIVYLFWAVAAGIVIGAGMLPLAVIGSAIIGVILILFANKKYMTIHIF